MKKTLTVNLGGTVYNIDEDAYTLLDSYLNNLRYHFRKNPEGEEIVRDMENRIAELFDECVSGGSRVVTVENVEAIIARMGKPESGRQGAGRCRFGHCRLSRMGCGSFAPASDCGRMFFPVAAFGLSGGMDYYPSRADGYGKTADAGGARQYGKYRPYGDRRI